MALVGQPLRKHGHLDVSVVLSFFPVAQIFVIETVLKQLDEARLCFDFNLSNIAHTFTSCRIRDQHTGFSRQQFLKYAVFEGFGFLKAFL